MPCSPFPTSLPGSRPGPGSGAINTATVAAGGRDPDSPLSPLVSGSPALVGVWGPPKSSGAGEEQPSPHRPQRSAVSTSTPGWARTSSIKGVTPAPAGPRVAGEASLPSGAEPEIPGGEVNQGLSSGRGVGGGLRSGPLRPLVPADSPTPPPGLAAGAAFRRHQEDPAPGPHRLQGPFPTFSFRLGSLHKPSGTGGQGADVPPLPPADPPPPHAPPPQAGVAPLTRGVSPGRKAEASSSRCQAGWRPVGQWAASPGGGSRFQKALPPRELRRGPRSL